MASRNSINKIIIAPDKFKGSLTGIEFCEVVERGIRKHVRDVEIIKLPLADGGDGTVEVLKYYLGGTLISAIANDPLSRPIKANYLFSEEKKMAFIEMAEASGIRLLRTNELNPLLTSTFGTGELIKDAIKKGANRIILGIGGSATNDAGMGMARALGYRFFDEQHKELEGRGSDLKKLKTIDSTKVISELKNVKFEVACDVDNPLYGPNGAAFVYSPQKGANAEMVHTLDLGLQNFNRVVQAHFEKDLQSIPGAGAAGGLGAGCILFLSAELKSGIKLIKDVANFDESIRDADWIITGEGKLDEQTFSGKVIKGILESRVNQKIATFCGLCEISSSEIEKHRIDYTAETINKAKNVADSLKNATLYLEQLAEEFTKKVLMKG